ncbi:MAG: dihydrofolate reductase family protein [Pseudolysinimonas sp.]|uniref:dihydrofolate reductase family protein n=1 Tax=Pseudolysinimonas sp. TaxID=2680009 RepID=UPI003267B772
MIIRPLLPAGDPIDTSSPDARQLIAALYPAPGLRVNLVASVDGGTSDAAGTSAGLTEGADRVILGAIRLVSDTVLIGAATLRAEGSLVPRSTHLTVLTTTGDFTGAVVRADIEPGRILVVGPAKVEERARATFNAPFEYFALDGDRAVPLAVMLTALRDRGLAKIVCEGGPRLAGQLLAAGLVDELCLTTVPRLLGNASALFGGATGGSRSLDLVQVLTDEGGSLYGRWRVS